MISSEISPSALLPRGHFSRSRSLADYDARFGAGVVLDTVRARAATTPDASLLEIGCGEGRVLMQLRKAFPALRLHGINKAPWPAMQGSESLRATALHHGIFDAATLEGLTLPTVHFADAGALPLADASLDVVISQVTIPYVERKERVLTETWRVLKPGGVALLHLDSRRRHSVDFLAGDTPTFVSTATASGCRWPCCSPSCAHRESISTTASRPTRTQTRDQAQGARATC